MKLIFVIICYIIATILALPSHQKDPMWEQYKSTHEKAYKTVEEEQERYVLFLKKVEEIKEHNAKYDHGLTTYQKGINRFSDWTLGEMSTYLNRNTTRKLSVDGISYSTFDPPKGLQIPDEVDWRIEGAVTPVKDEGRLCPSSWSFSVTGALEGILKIIHNESISLSEQNLIDCSSPKGIDGCKGGSRVRAFRYVKRKGILSELDYPYTQNSETCKFDIDKAVIQINGYARVSIGDEQALKAAVAIQPVSIKVNGKFDFADYKSGIFVGKDCWPSSEDLNHELLAVGYGSENGVDYWIVKNSWGTRWGEDGYIRMIRNQDNHCGVATSAYLPIGPYLFNN